MKIAYQGVKGAYSHIAAMEVFSGQEYVACETFALAMDMVQKGEADFAMIPVENSNAGRVSDVHMLLPKTGLHIVGEHFLRIEHQLLGVKGAKLEDIKTVSSHPQALAQCSEFIQNHHITPIARIDTAKSCDDVAKAQDKTMAAIASKLAGQIYCLDILASNIENASNNTTRFLIMSREEKIPEYDGGAYVTSLIFNQKYSGRALQSSRWFCHQQHQYYQNRELSLGRQICISAILFGSGSSSCPKVFSKCFVRAQLFCRVCAYIRHLSEKRSFCGNLIQILRINCSVTYQYVRSLTIFLKSYYLPHITTFLQKFV